MNKPKMQGTAFESWLVKHFAGEGFDAARLAEGGSNDLGDIAILDPVGDEWIIEAKATQALNVTRVLGKAIQKGGPRTILIWKRLVKTDKKVRQADGEKIVVVLTLDLFTELLSERNDG